jgi:hypothetical protein
MQDAALASRNKNPVQRTENIFISSSPTAVFQSSG